MSTMPTFGAARPLARPSNPRRVAEVATTWDDLGAVPTIAATPNPPASRAIVQLQPFGERVFLAYGEWDIGLDACDLLAWNAETGQYETLLDGLATDAIWVMRVVNDRLWALCTDPSVGTDPDAAVFDGTAVQVIASNQVTPWHLFDVTGWNDALFLAGANRVEEQSNAAVWRSRDGGQSWHIVLEAPGNLRMHGLFAFEDSLFAVGVLGETWRSDDGARWQRTNLNLVPRGSICLRPSVVAGRATYLTGWPAFGPQSLYVFDGQTSMPLNDIGLISNFFVSDEEIWVLTADQTVLRSRDLRKWEVIATDAPSQGCSLCTLSDGLYVGTTDSRLWRTNLTV